MTTAFLRPLGGNHVAPFLSAASFMVACSEEPCPDLDYEESDAVIRAWVEIYEWGDETLEAETSYFYFKVPNDVTEARLRISADSEELFDEVVAVETKVCLVAPTGADVLVEGEVRPDADVLCDGWSSHFAEAGKVVDLWAFIDGCSLLY